MEIGHQSLTTEYPCSTDKSQGGEGDVCTVIHQERCIFFFFYLKGVYFQVPIH